MNVPSRQVCEEVPDAPYVSLEKEGETPAGFGVAIAVAPAGLPSASIRSLPVAGGSAHGAAYRVEWDDGVCETAFCHGTPERRTYGSIVSDGASAASIQVREGSRTLFLGFGSMLAAPVGGLRLAGGRGSVAVTVAAGSAEVWFEGGAAEIRLRSLDIEHVRLAGRNVPFARDGEDVVVRLRPAGPE